MCCRIPYHVCRDRPPLSFRLGVGYLDWSSMTGDCRCYGDLTVGFEGFRGFLCVAAGCSESWSCFVGGGGSYHKIHRIYASNWSCTVVGYCKKNFRGWCCCYGLVDGRCFAGGCYCAVGYCGFSSIRRHC